jgi:GR25 family glycosyltransferase involved in LPS biosynthesis
MNIPIFCINLERATERRKKIEKLWIEELGFDITFWKAWDRRDIENGKFYYPYNPELTQNTIKRQLSSGEIACATSHCMVYEYALKNNLEYCIVMEDDIFPNPIFQYLNDKKLPKIVFNYIKKCLIEHPSTNILLMHRVCCDNRFSIKQEKEHCYITHTPPYGAQMNYYSLSGIHNTLEVLKTMQYLVDEYPKIITDVCLIKCPIAYHYEIKANIKHPKYTSDIRTWVNKK